MRVPAGSLVRVAGTELVIPCNVSDYDGPSEQNFDWSFSSSGSSFVELASTWEVGFPAQLYQERLQRGEILLRRTANDAVELHIKNVQPSDQGHYKCSTPSTDATVQGNYEDTVQVKGTSSRDGRCAKGQTFLCRLAVGDFVEKLTASGALLPPPSSEVIVCHLIKGRRWARWSVRTLSLSSTVILNCPLADESRVCQSRAQL